MSRTKVTLLLMSGVSGTAGLGIWLSLNKETKEEQYKTSKDRTESEITPEEFLLNWQQIANIVNKRITHKKMTVANPEDNWWSSQWQTLKDKFSNKSRVFSSKVKENVEEFKKECFMKMGEKEKKRLQESSSEDWIDAVEDLFGDDEDGVHGESYVDVNTLEEDKFFGYSCFKRLS